MAHLNAENSREALRRYWSESMVWAKDKNDARRWVEKHKRAGGWMPYTGDPG